MANQIIPDSEFIPDQEQQPMVVNPAPGQTDFIPDNQFVSDEQSLQNKYGGDKGEVQTFTEGVIKGILGPIAAPLLNAYGVPKEQLLGHEQANPTAAGAGELTGFLTGAGVGEAALLGRAGEAAAAATGLKSGGRIAQAGAEAINQGFQGLLMQGGEELHKAFIEDPAQTSDNVISHLGMTSVLSGLFGGAVGAAFAKSAPAAEKLISEIDHPNLALGDLETGVKYADNLTEGKKFNVIKDLTKAQPKANMSEVDKAAKVLGVEATEGMRFSNKGIQIGEDALLNTPQTTAGAARIARYDSIYNTAEKAVDDAIQVTDARTKEQAGELVQRGLVDEVEKQYKPIQDLYAKRAEVHGTIPLTENPVEALTKDLSEVDAVRLSPRTPEGRLVRQVLQIAGEGTVNTAKDLDTLAGMALLKDTGVAGVVDPLGHLKGKIKDAIYSTQRRAIDAADPALRKLSKEATDAYSPYIKRLSTLSEWLGKGKISGTEGALKFIGDKLTATELSQKLFSSSKDPAFIRFFEKEFPEQWQGMREYQRSVLREDSLLPDNRVDIAKLWKKLDKLEPEVQEALFTKDELAKIKAAHTVVDNFPKAYNTSKTSHASRFMEDLGRTAGWGAAGMATAGPIGGVAGAVAGHLFPEARDAFLLSQITRLGKTVEGQQAIKLAQATIKGENAANKAIKSIFTAGKEMPSSVIPFAASRAKLDRLASKAVQDPSRLVALNDNNNSVPQYNAPLAASAARVVNYLAQLKPNTDPASPLDSKRVPSSAEKSAYDRALDIAEQPLTVLDGLKQGRITPSDVQAIRSMYPNLYNKLVSKITSGIVDATDKGRMIPYQTRIGLSIFLGQPMDSTMTPANILNAQPQTTSNSHPAADSASSTAKGYQSEGLKKLPGQYQTPGQARQQRMQKN